MIAGNPRVVEATYPVCILRGFQVPIIDVYAPADLFPVCTDHQLAVELTAALPRAEGVATPLAAHLISAAG